MLINEDLLQYIWNYRLFEAGSLKTKEGEEIHIVNTGSQNFQSGPDFTNAKIFIGNQQWIGNVEIHIDPIDWYRHGHHEDPAYDSIILHVSLFENKRDIITSSGKKIPELFLNGFVKRNCLEKYKSIKESLHWIPCQAFLPEYKDLLSRQIPEFLIERLISKSMAISDLILKLNFDWETCFKQLLTIGFGFHTNKAGFEALSSILNYKLIEDFREDHKSVEAIVFGQSGLFDLKLKDPYFLVLKKQFKILQQRYQLAAIKPVIWKFSGIRPRNFPTLRLAQLSSLLSFRRDWIQAICSLETIDKLNQFLNCDTSEYWLKHYRFGIESKPKPKVLGKSSVEIIIINVVVPFLYHYGIMKHEHKLAERSLNLLHQCKPEANTIVSRWNELGIKARNAFESQSLIQLKKEYCDKFKCLNCNIGKQLIRG